jgi:hypothetical protein
MLLYHYTFEKNIASIRKEGLRPSIRIEDIPATDAQHGNGHYLTDLAPEIVEKFTRPQVSQALFKLPRKWGLTGKLQIIAFIEFNLPDGKLKRVHDLFPRQVQKQYPELGIWLHPSEEVLWSEYIQGWGLISFQPMPSGNQ